MDREKGFVPWDQRAPAATQQVSDDTRCEPSLGHVDSPPVDQFSSVSQAVLRERLDSGQRHGAPGCNQLTPRPVRGRSGATKPGLEDVETRRNLLFSRVLQCENNVLQLIRQVLGLREES